MGNLFSLQKATIDKPLFCCSSINCFQSSNVFRFITPPDKISRYFLVTTFISEGVIYRTLTVETLKARLAKKLTQPITTTQGAFSVGVSIGHASYPEEGKTLEELIYIADERMFEDKKQNIPSN